MPIMKFILLSGASAVILSGCLSPTGNYTQSEQEIVNNLSGDRFRPATRERRDAIETQELMAQAAFWANEHSLNPADLESSIKLAASVRKMGNAAKAVEITQQARALHPRDPYLLAELSAALISAEQPLAAIDILDEGLALAPQYARLWSLKGAALDQQEHYEAARKHYARAMQITPNDPNILANVGLSFALAGDAPKAEQWLRRAASIPGAGAGVRQNLALVLQLQGKTEEAARLLPRNLVASRQHGPVQHQTRPQSYTQQAKANTPRVYGTPSSAQSPNSRYSPANLPQPRAPQGYHNTSIITPSGQAKTASDAAREAANAMKGPRKEIIPVQQQQSAEQQSVLDQIARSLGPKPNNNVIAPPPQGYPANPTSGRSFRPQSGYPVQNTSPSTPQLAGPPQPSSPQSRGAARRRR